MRILTKALLIAVFVSFAATGAQAAIFEGHKGNQRSIDNMTYEKIIKKAPKMLAM